MNPTATAAGPAKTDFIDILPTAHPLLQHFLNVAMRLKKQYQSTGRNEPLAAGKVLAMIFEKPSLRTRVSFDVAMQHLGGSAIYISPNEIGLGVRESIPDAARVLSGFCDAVMARTFAHATIEGLAKHSRRPVINGLSDHSHPCQVMADIMTIQEHFGHLDNLNVAYVGDGNNVARSLLEICGLMGINFRIAAPAGYELDQRSIDAARAMSRNLNFMATTSPREAVRGADVIYTDTWISMGHEDEKAVRLPIFHPYQINRQLLADAPGHAVVMHCLPAYRGVEITDEVLDGPQSVVFDQAENRLHFQKGLLAVLLGGQ